MCIRDRLRTGGVNEDDVRRVAAPPDPPPVSYTHLDVYKRQARANIAALCPGVRFLEGDAAAPLAELPELAPLAGRVDVVTCNPPYIPDGMMPIDPEVRDHDPAMALFGLSPDGLAVPRRMAARAAELLRPGGLLAMEHGQEQGRSLPCLLYTSRCV